MQVLPGIPNYEILVLARQSRGLSQVDLAESLGIAQGTISKIEHGAIQAPSDVVERLGERLRYPVTFFYRHERVRGSDSICFHHRKRAFMSPKLLTTIEAQMYVTQLNVTSLLDEVEIVAPNEFATLDPDEYGRDPRAVAQLVRSMWHLPRGPIANLVDVIEAAGGVVVFRDFGTQKLDGMSCWPNDGPPLFFINSAIRTDRARLTLAHELGHLIMHATPPARDPEVEANAFASEFLVPRAEVMADLRRLRFGLLPELKAYWRVSMGALVMAAKEADAIPDNKIRSLFVQLSRRGYRMSEPYPLAPEEPRIVREAVKVHLEQHGYSVDELADIAGRSPDEFRNLYWPDTAPPLLRVFS